MNTIKYLSYKLAFEQIKKAIEDKYFLEAVMIEESLISDRLQSMLLGKKEITDKEYDRHIGLARLIKLAQVAIANPVHYERLMKWKDARNFVAHRIAKSKPGTPTITTTEFFKKAEAAAVEGLKLVRIVNKLNLR